MSLRTQVTLTVAGCFAVLRQLRSIRRSVPDPVFQSLVVIGTDKARLRQRNAYWPASLSVSPAAVGT